MLCYVSVQNDLYFLLPAVIKTTFIISIISGSSWGTWSWFLVTCPFNMQPCTRTPQCSSVTLLLNLFFTASLVKNAFTHFHQADESINPASSWAADWIDDCLRSTWLIVPSQLDDDWLDQMLNEAERKMTSFVPNTADVLQLCSDVIVAMTWWDVLIPCVRWFLCGPRWFNVTGRLLLVVQLHDWRVCWCRGDLQSSQTRQTDVDTKDDWRFSV